jgi:hypothetical protein
VNNGTVRDASGTVAHLLNLHAVSVLTYAYVTRGALLVSSLLNLIVRSS